MGVGDPFCWLLPLWRGGRCREAKILRANIWISGHDKKMWPLQRGGHCKNLWLLVEVLSTVMITTDTLNPQVAYCYLSWVTAH